jgi:hypothetical protein
MHYGNPTQGHRKPNVILPKEKPKKTAENRVETTAEKIKRVLKETAGTMSGRGTGTDKSKVDRGQQFANYLRSIDWLESKRISLKRGLVRDPGEQLVAQSGQISGVRTTKMSDIMDNYHAKALRLAQAKYYQKQVG